MIIHRRTIESSRRAPFLPVTVHFIKTKTQQHDRCKLLIFGRIGTDRPECSPQGKWRDLTQTRSNDVSDVAYRCVLTR